MKILKWLITIVFILTSIVPNVNAYWINQTTYTDTIGGAGGSGRIVAQDFTTNSSYSHQFLNTVSLYFRETGSLSLRLYSSSSKTQLLATSPTIDTSGLDWHTFVFTGVDISAYPKPYVEYTTLGTGRQIDVNSANIYPGGSMLGHYQNYFSGTNDMMFRIDISTPTIISCPIGWCYLAQNYTNKTLLELDNLFSTDTIQGWYNSSSQKYESHRTGYSFNANVNVTQKNGYYYYFSSAQNVTMTPGSTPSITLKQGWNLVANYGTSVRTLSDLKTSIGASATQAQYYDKTLKTWVSTDSQSVPAMESFFVYVTSQTDWSD